MNDIKRRSQNLRSNIKTPLAPRGDFANRGKINTNNKLSSDILMFDKFQENDKLEEKLRVFESRAEELEKRNANLTKSKNNSNKKFKMLKNRFHRYLLFIIILSGAIWFLLTYIFNKAYLYITPVSIDRKFTDDFKLKINKNENDYEIVQIEKMSSVKISKSETKNIQSKFSGDIIVYNYLDKPQKLIKNTRFESDNNNIYRINNTIIIPASKNNIPGSAKVIVTAENYGSEYNLSIKTKLTVLNFKNSDKYNKIYAEIISNITSGQNGVRSIVAKEDIDNNTERIKTDLTEKIRNDLLKTNKPNYISATDSIYIIWSNNINEYESNEAENYTVTGIGYKALIKSDVLAKLIASKTINGYNNESVRLVNNNFQMKYIGDIELNNATNTLSFILSGNVKLIYNIKEDEIKNNILGKKNDTKITEEILFKDKTLSSVITKLFPLWIKNYPESKDKIIIQENKQ